MVNHAEEERRNKDVMNELMSIEEKIQDERYSEKPNKAKIAELRLQQFYKGLAMNTGFIRTNGYNRF